MGFESSIHNYTKANGRCDKPPQERESFPERSTTTTSARALDSPTALATSGFCAAEHRLSIPGSTTTRLLERPFVRFCGWRRTAPFLLKDGMPAVPKASEDRLKPGFRQAPMSRRAFRCCGETVCPHRFRNSSPCWRKTSATSSRCSFTVFCRHRPR